MQNHVSWRAADDRSDIGDVERLWRDHADVVRRTVSSYRLNPADAADAAQNTWLRLLERSSTIREPDKVASWLATTARRECLAEIRRTRRVVPCDLDAADRPCLAPSPEDSVISGETRRAVRIAVGSLAGRARRLVDELYSDAGPTPYADVAQRLTMPLGSIGPTRARAFARLRRELARLGLTPLTAPQFGAAQAPTGLEGSPWSS